MKIALTMLILLLFTLGCKKQEATVYQVPDQWKPYVDRFYAEAAQRGIAIPKNNLLMQSSAGNDGALCGSCNSVAADAQLQKVISIYTDHPCWFNDSQLETLVFHELGHCLLGRVHTTDTLPNGNPASIMVPDNLSLYSPCLYPIGNQPCDYSYKREYYVNELFNKEEAPPAWSR